MRLGLVSDIHADPLALGWAIDHLKRLGVDRILAAGDLVGHGPLPDLVVDRIKAERIQSARGNHDRWTVNTGPGVPYMYGGAVASAETVAWLETLPPRLHVAGHDRVGLIVHATPEDDVLGITPSEWSADQLDQLLQNEQVDFLVVGHTHVPMCHRSKFGAVINPGSLVTVPGVPSSRSFAILNLENLEVAFHDVETALPRHVKSWDQQRARHTP